MPILSPKTLRRVKITIIEKLADELQLDMLWDAFAKTTLQQENRLKPVLRAVFRRQKEDVLRRMERNPIPEERGIKAPSDIYNPWLFSDAEWKVVLEEAARPFIEASMFEGTEEAILGINNDLDIVLPIEFNVRDPNIQVIINDKLQKFSFEVNAETTRLLKDEFIEGLAKGESIRKLEARVAKVFGFTSRVRTNRIARTEIIGAHNAGSFEAMVNSGIVATKRWINSRDAKVRETHQTSEVVPLMELFSMGLRFPGDWTGDVGEIVNCRCAMRAETYLI